MAAMWLLDAESRIAQQWQEVRPYLCLWLPPGTVETIDNDVLILRALLLAFGILLPLILGWLLFMTVINQLPTKYHFSSRAWLKKVLPRIPASKHAEAFRIQTPSQAMAIARAADPALPLQCRASSSGGTQEAANLLQGRQPLSYSERLDAVDARLTAIERRRGKMRS